MNTPDTWAVVAYFTLVALGIALSLFHRDNSVHIFSAIAKTAQRFNRGLVAWTGLSSKLVVGLELGLLLTAGGLMITLEQYAITVVAWIILGFVVVVKAFGWQGTPNALISGFLRTAWVCAGIALCAFLILSTDLLRDDKPWFPRKCIIVAAVKSEIIAVVHLHAKWVPGGHDTEVYKPMFQDLFHEWKITVTPNKKTPRIVVTIRDVREPMDKIRVAARNATISEPKAGWSSGFEESTHTPEFYDRTVTLSDLDASATITIRRPLKANVGTITLSGLNLDLDRTVYVSADKCRIELRTWPATAWPLSKQNVHFWQLTKEFEFMINEKNLNGRPVTRPDPDQPFPQVPIGESVKIDELHCADDSCSTLSVYDNAEKTRLY